jgi:chromosome segregation and condensation protein ScpB
MQGSDARQGDRRMKLFNGMTRRQRIDFLERAAIRANRELSVVALQVLAVIASMDTINLPLIRRRRSALLLTINMAQVELEQLHDEEGDAQESR